MKKLEPISKILNRMEPDLYKLVDEEAGHGLQKGELRALFMSWVDIHYPSAIEPYTDNTEPIDFYGHEDALLALAERIKKRKEAWAKSIEE